MSIIMYGSELCEDTMEAKKLFEENKVEYVFKDITKELSNLKEFLAIRDTNSCYSKIREEHGIGMPCIVKEDGSITLEPKDVL
ncbi:hypothetical protein [Clostridium brassicae]|uniref:Glutaredoxin n=1 Tax=Clostridium brassicae TaxID=2999072 RepID=A0ABT4DC81_9CLOT|nr:hypothetical protein [Clostridium brassicae]MCY6959922.1 hypothetical protein [Clostridium brassicae]